MYPLTTLLLLPSLGALVILALPAAKGRLIRRAAAGVAAVTLAYACWLMRGFDRSATGMQYFESHAWNPRLGATFSLGVDGFSLPMVVLAALLCFTAVLASGAIRDRMKGYYFLLLLLEAGMLGVFTAQDWALFYVFWELTLLPLFFLIDRWGGANRHGAALNFVLYTMGGSVFLLISLLVLFDSVPGHSFAMANIAAGAPGLSGHAQLLIFLGFLVGFGVKMPIFPIHGWLPLAHVEAPSPVSILLSGILLKMGAYGLIRVAAILPEAVVAMQEALALLALVSLLYGGLLAWRQSDLKRMIAYSSVSHMGVVLLGIATLNAVGVSGAVMQMIAHGLVAGALFLLVGLLYERTHTRDINDYSSLVRVMPRFAFFTVLAFVAAIGIPGTAGFVAELQTLIGGFQRWGWYVLPLSLGILVSAAYAIRTVGRLFTGPVRSSMRDVADLGRTELFAALTLAAGILFLGILPATALDLMSASVADFSGNFGVAAPGGPR